MGCCQRCRSSACVQHLSDRGYFSEAKQTINLAIGMALQSVSLVMLNPVATAFAGHLGKVELDAVSLANTIFNVFGNAIVFGMATACDTYFSQAYGNNQLQLLGVLLQRAIIIFTLLFLVLSPIYINMEQLLLVLGQDPQVSKLVGQYIIVVLPGLMFVFASTLLRRYLACQNIVLPGVIIGFVSLAVLVLFQYIFLYQLYLGVIGSALAMNMSCFALFALMIGYILITKIHKKSWGGWSWKMLEHWGPFTKLGIYGAMMMCLEWWAFEISVLLAGVLGTTELGAQGVFFNTEAVLLSFGIGVGDAAGIRVGRALGKGDAGEAKRAAKIGFVLTTAITSVLAVLIIALRYELPKIFTNVSEVLALTSSMLPIMAFYIFFDNIAFVGRGVTRGAGKQGLVTIMVAIAYYLIGMPIGIPLMFLTPVGLIGIWYGLTTAVVISGTFFLVYSLRFLDWKAAAKEAYDRVQAAKSGSRAEDSDIDNYTEKSSLVSSSVTVTGRQRSSLSISHHGDEAMLDEDLNSPLDKVSLTKKRLVVVAVVLVIFTTGILCNIFLPAPDLDTLNNSTITNSSYVSI